MSDKIIFPNYDKSILSITSSVLNCYGAKCDYPALDELKLSPNGKNMLIILDGLGSNVLRRMLPETAFLRRNTVATVTSVFPPTTVAATTAYYSGKSPRETGWMGWHQYFKDYAADAVVFASEEYYHPKRRLSPHVTQSIDYENLFEQICKADRDVSLHSLSPFPSVSARGADHDHRISEFEQICARLLKIARSDGNAFALAYWPHPDATMHETGCDSNQTRKQYIDLDNALERLYEMLPTDTRLIVSSDHGLTDVSECVDLAKIPEVWDMMAMPPSLDSRAAAIYLKPDRMDDFKKWFEKNLSDDFMLFTKQNAEKVQLFGRGKAHPKYDDFFGSVIVAATGRRFIECSVVGKPIERLLGRHAGLTADEMLVDVIFADKKA